MLAVMLQRIQGFSFLETRPSTGIKLITVAVFFALLGCTFFLSHHTKTYIYQHKQAQFAKKAQSVSSHIESRINEKIKPLQSLKRKWELLDGDLIDGWKHSASCLANYHTSFQSVQLLDPAFQVTWVTPLKGNERAMSIDMSVEDNRREALNIAKQTGNIQITRVVQLLQGGDGFLIYTPLFTQETISGYILGVVRMDKLLKPVIENQSRGNYHFALYDGKHNFLNSPELSYEHFPNWQQHTTIKVQNIEWELVLWPKKLYVNKLNIYLPTAIIAIGTLLSFLAAFLVYRHGKRRTPLLSLKAATSKLEVTSY